MFLKYSCQKPLKKNCGRPVFLEELQAARNFSKVSLHFNKIPNFLRQVLQAYSEICIFCVLKNCPPGAVNEDFLVRNMKVTWDIRYTYFSYDFLIFFKCYDFAVL